MSKGRRRRDLTFVTKGGRKSAGQELRQTQTPENPMTFTLGIVVGALAVIGLIFVCWAFSTPPRF